MPTITSDKQFSTWQRAASAALLGLGTQIALLIAVVLLQFAKPTQSMLGLALFVGCGIPVWITTWALFATRKQQRLEEIEREQTLKSADTTSMFLDAADALTPSAKRFRWMAKWLLPIVSVLVGVLLLTLGLIQLRGLFGGASNPSPDNVGLHFGYIGGILFLTLLAVAYLRGMARVADWQLLRAGSTFLAGAMLDLLIYAVAFGISLFFGVGLAMDIANLIAPWFLILIGAEILFTQILDFYRPRRTNEVGRPAFDSRLLLLLTSPGSVVKTLNEAINYQFGFEITRSWFWQLLARHALSLVLFGAAVLLAISCIVIVEPNQQALVLRFGNIVSDKPLPQGIHFKLPWPIDTVEAYDVTGSRTARIGSHIQDLDTRSNAILWTNAHAGDKENYVMLAPSRGVPQSLTASQTTNLDADSRGPSVSLAGVEVFVQYRVKDLMQFVKSSRNTDQRIIELADAEVARFLFRFDIDQLMGEGRQQAASTLHGIIQQRADAARLGVEIVWVGIAGVHPAQQVAAAFHETVGAEQEKQSAILTAQKDATRLLAEAVGNEAQAGRIEKEISVLDDLQSKADQSAVVKQEQLVEQMIQQAGGRASQLLSEARAYRWQTVNAELGRAQRFLKEIEAFNNAPDLYRTRRYLETLSEGMASSRKYMLVTRRSDLTIRGDLKDVSGSLDQIADPAGSQNQTPTNP
jgi:modulator of FtsH protease HflK